MANGRGHGTHQWRLARTAVLNQRPLICYLCGYDIDVSIKYPSRWSASVDCIIPASLGGSTVDRSNLAPAHLWCNQKKADSLPGRDEFIEVAELDP